MRHALILSPRPADVVLGLCNNSKCQLDRVVGHTSIGLTKPELLANAGGRNGENSRMHFNIRTTCDGNLLKTLVDTGATTNYISSELISKTPELKDKTESVPPISTVPFG